ncbi:MAG: SRPBCC family protein [Candidatus Limnocylindria bacterium]
MPRTSFSVVTPLPPEAVLAAVTDFSERRLEIWPALDGSLYRLHARGDTWAEATEGGGPFPGMWARERYDWSRPGTVSAEIIESSIFRPGGRWELHVEPLSRGSRATVVWDRRPKGLKGLLVTALVVTVGRGPMADQLRQALANYARLEAG